MEKTVTINWSITVPDPNDLDYAEILRCDPGLTVFSPIMTEPNLNALTPNSQATFSYGDVIDIPINTSKTYSYKIKVYDADGNYNESAPTQVTLEMLPPPEPVIDSIVVT